MVYNNIVTPYVQRAISGIKKDLEPLIILFYQKYFVHTSRPFSFTQVDLTDERMVSNILRSNIKSSLEFHMFYRWIGLSSQWAVEGEFQTSTLQSFWHEYETYHKARYVIERLLKDFDTIGKIEAEIEDDGKDPF